MNSYAPTFSSDFALFMTHTSILRNCCLLLFILFAGTAGVKAQSGKTSVGLQTGYSHWLVRDELQSFRNFYGGSLVVGGSLLKESPARYFSVDLSYQHANLIAWNSALTCRLDAGQVNVSWLKKMNPAAAAFDLRMGVRLANQLSARTYSFNSPVAGQDPFTGEFFTSPALAVRATKGIKENAALSWQVSYSPLAYLFSRGHHPIRAFQTFGDIPRGVVLVPHFHDFQSVVAFSRNVGERFSMSVNYAWRFVQYNRSYPLQAGNHTLALQAYYKIGR